MAEHNLCMDEVEKKEGGEQSWLDEDAYETGKWTLEDNLAWGIVHRHFFVEAYFGHKHVEKKEGKHRQVKVLRFFGRPDNVQTAKWTFNALIDAFDRLFSEYRKRTGAPASDRRIFITGVASGFTPKMNDERRAMEVERDLVQGKTSGSTALALAGIGEQTIMAYKEASPRVLQQGGQQERQLWRRQLRTVTGDPSAFEAGQRAGLIPQPEPLHRRFQHKETHRVMNCNSRHPVRAPDQGAAGWGTLDRYPSMTEAIADAKALTRRQAAMPLPPLDGETMEPVSYFDTIGSVVHASTVG